MSISGGLARSFGRGEAAGCTAMQIFTKNASQWRARPIDAEEARAFRDAWQQSIIGPVIAHDSYLINLATTDREKWSKSKTAFTDELERCALLGITSLVMHPGNHLGAGDAAGIAQVVAAFQQILTDAPAEVRILVENTAGQGSALGWNFAHLAAILESLPQERFGVCFDTCHALAAGYDLTSAAGYANVMAEFDRLVGVERIHAFHINDSKKGLASRVDRHAQLGDGALGLDGLRALMQDPRFTGVAKILETPKGNDDNADKRNIAILRELAGDS